jgi:hypothetical protein
MSAETKRKPDDERRRLRDHVARLTSRILELERQLEDVKRERAEATMEALATAALRAVRSAETAMAAEDPERRYVVSRLETTFRGFLAQRAEGVALSLPIPEYAAPPGSVGSLQMTFLRAPAPPTPSTPVGTLGEVLERAQAAFAAWDRELGAAPARDMTGHLTHLVILHEQGDNAGLLRTAHAAAETAVRFGSALGREVPAELLRPYGVAAEKLFGLTRQLVRAGRLAPEDLAKLAGALDGLTQSFLAVVESRTR